MDAHIKDKQDDESDKMNDKTKKARQMCRRKERKRMIKMGCGCSGMTACAPQVARTYDGQEKPQVCACEAPKPRKVKEDTDQEVELPPGLPAKGPRQSLERGSGSSGGSSQDHQKAQKEQEWKDMMAQRKQDMTWRNRMIQSVEEQWDDISITVDSGAVDTVGPKDVGSQFPITPTRESELGLGYRAANGSPIKNYGERVLNGQTAGGQ